MALNNYFPTNNSAFYMQDLQNMRDRIDKQIHQIQMQNQFQTPQQAPITQNFQIAPTQTNSDLEAKYVNSIDDVKNTFVIKTGIFVDKGFKNLWVKDVTGNIKTFKTEEIIEMDEKDKEIYMLKKQIEDMKGMMLNDTKSDNINANGTTSKKKSSRVSNDSTSDE